MRQIRLLGLSLLAVLAFGVVVAATASASESGSVLPGLLLLPKEAEGLEISGTSGKGQLTSAGGQTIICESNTELPDGVASGTHIELIKVHIHFKGCKNGKLACNSEGDEKEVLLVLVDLHFVNWKNTETGKLEAGVEAIILNAKQEPGTIVIKCGIGIVEIRGSVGGLLKVTTLTADVTSGTLVFPISSTLVCDPEGMNTQLCINILKEKPLEANFSGKFEKATETTEASVTFSKMVEVDD